MFCSFVLFTPTDACTTSVRGRLRHLRVFLYFSRVPIMPYGGIVRHGSQRSICRLPPGSRRGATLLHLWARNRQTRRGIRRYCRHQGPSAECTHTPALRQPRTMRWTASSLLLFIIWRILTSAPPCRTDAAGGHYHVHGRAYLNVLLTSRLWWVVSSTRSLAAPVPACCGTTWSALHQTLGAVAGQTRIPFTIRLIAFVVARLPALFAFAFMAVQAAILFGYVSMPHGHWRLLPFADAIGSPPDASVAEPTEVNDEADVDGLYYGGEESRRHQAPTLRPDRPAALGTTPF